MFDLSSLVWTQTVQEPVMKDDSTSNPPSETLVAGIGARGAWQPQVITHFDIQVVDTDAPSCLGKSPQTIIRTAEREKKLKYEQACEDRHVNFILLCVSVDGLVCPETNTFLQLLTQRLSFKWDTPYNTSLFWIRAKLSFSLIRATNLCIRGTRTKWRGIGMEHGSGINDINI